MKEERILDVLEKVDDKYIQEAEPEAKTTRKAQAWTKWMVVAASLCIVVFAISKIPVVKEMGSHMLNNKNDDMCQVIKFDVPQTYSVSSLYYLSKPVDESIKEYIVENKINVNPEDGISVSNFSSEEDEINYWFPVIIDGRISEFVYISQTMDGTIVCGYSESDADMVEALSVYTSSDNPMSIVVYGNYAYFVIGNKAYINSAHHSKSTEIPKPVYTEAEVQQHILDLY